MAKSWDSYGRKGLDIAHSASTFGFSAAKVSTRLGVSAIQFISVFYYWVLIL
jgi:sn1-specific diacylglycerol lipase